MNFTTDQFNWNNSTNTFSQEASSLKLQGIPSEFTLLNKKTGVSANFKFVKHDYSGSGEDREIAGWNYVATMSKGTIKINALIIND